jgi:hypothetical protein
MAGDGWLCCAAEVLWVVVRGEAKQKHGAEAVGAAAARSVRSLAMCAWILKKLL